MVFAALGLQSVGRETREKLLLEEALAFCERNPESKDLHRNHKHFIQADKEGLICWCLGFLLGAVVIGLHVIVEEPLLKDMDLLWRIFFYINSTALFFSASLVIPAVLAELSLFGLLAALLSDVVEKHFANSKRTLLRNVPDSKSEAILGELEEDLNSARTLFAMTNNRVTHTVVGVVLITYSCGFALVLGFILMLKLQKTSGEEMQIRASFVVVLCLTCLCTGMSTRLLYALTKVANRYIGCATEMSLDLKIRIRMSKVLPGPQGVYLLQSFENTFVNELSFAIDHCAIDRRVLEQALLRLVAGALMTVAIGILSG